LARLQGRRAGMTLYDIGEDSAQLSVWALALDHALRDCPLVALPLLAPALIDRVIQIVGFGLLAAGRLVEHDSHPAVELRRRSGRRCSWCCRLGRQLWRRLVDRLDAVGLLVGQ